MHEGIDADVQVGAYFYPHTEYCPHRSYRAGKVLDEVGIDGSFELTSDFELARTAPPLFDGHDQPRTYCLPGSASHIQWDDYDSDSLVSQCAFAQMHGLSYFVFDAYDGARGGRAWYELATPLEQIGKLASNTALGLLGFKYAKMETLESSRVLLPIPINGPREHDIAFKEPDRFFDVSAETARVIVDSSLQHWRNKRDYLYVGDRPYLSVLMPYFSPQETDKEIQYKLNDFVSAIRNHSLINGFLPYLVGVMRNTGKIDRDRWVEAGVDAITEYCSLPFFGEGTAPIQGYAELIKRRQLGWDALRGDIPYMPSPAVGWDASPRGERGQKWADVQGIHPYTPIVVGNTPELFGESIRSAIQFARLDTPAKEERLVTIFAWNEIGEGAALLQRLREGGILDNSYLKAAQLAIGLS